MLRLKHFEFWNTHIFHLPVYLYWLYLSLKARSPFFFSAANPGIENGGLMGESKFEILKKTDSRFIPKTIFFKDIPDLETTLGKTYEANIRFPFVVKPDIGQGGWLIDLIRDEKDLINFLLRIKIPFMIQEYVDLPVELGILYYRFPGEKKGVISSVATKDMLFVTGDGRRSVLELMKSNRRASRQLTRLMKSTRVDLHRIPDIGEKISLSFVGNHSYGTAFRNANHLIDEPLTKQFDSLCNDIAGFYFGRFDIRCESVSALKEGRFSILELNGVGSEPLHIFDPSEKLMNAYRCEFRHWKIIYKISRLNISKEAPRMKLSEALDTYKNVLRIQRLHGTGFTIEN